MKSRLTSLLIGLGLVIGTLLLGSAGSRSVAAKDSDSPAVGTWEGTLDAGPQGQLRVVVHISQAADGALTATLDSPDQGAKGIPISKITFKDPDLSFESAAVGGSYQGTMNKEHSEIAGTWSQGGGSLPLKFKRAETPAASK
jgi:uncharacterized protein